MCGGEDLYEDAVWRKAPEKARPRRRWGGGGIPWRPILLLLAAGFVLGWFLRGWVSCSEGLGFRKDWITNSYSAAKKDPPECPDWIVQDFLAVNPYSRPGDPLEEVTGIVVHYVGNPGTTAAQNRSYFGKLALTGETYASSHFLVGLEGEIIQNIPLDEIAYCSSQRNGDTISIECCHPGADGAFTDETYRSLVKLVKWLMDSYGLGPEQVIRHYDVTGKRCPLYYVEHQDAWERFIADIAEDTPPG